MGHWLTLCKQHTDVQWCIGKQQAENLNGALVNGYANSRQRLNRVLVKGSLGHWSTSTALLHGAEVSVSLWLLSECFSSDVTELFTFMKLILIDIKYISICRLAFVKKRVNGILSSKFSKIF